MIDKNDIKELEYSLLSSCLTNPARVGLVRHTLTPSMFTDQFMARVWHLLSTDWDKGIRHTPVTVAFALAKNQKEKESEIKKYLAVMASSCILSDVNSATHQAQLLLEEYNNRKIIEIIDSQLSPREKAENISSLWREIGSSDPVKPITIGDGMKLVTERIASNYKRGGGLAGLSTGLVDVDKMLCGLEAGCLYVLAGRPGMGKTAAALTISTNIASQGNDVLFFSLEMSTQQLMHRVVARYAGITLQDQRNGSSSINFNILDQVTNNLQSMPMRIVDKSGMTAHQIVAKSHQLAKKIPPKLIVIDHLAIVTASDPRTPRVYQVAEMSMLFKMLSKELKCPVLLLHQLNRGVEGRDDKRPSMSDLRDSGSVEQDADAIMLLYRQEYYLRNKKPEDECKIMDWNMKLEDCKGKAEMIIAKNRQGESGVSHIYFNGTKQLFEDMARKN